MAQYLLDTNVVLRLLDPTAPEHPACRAATEVLTAAGHALLLAPQVIYEFWVVSTRPPANRGFGWPTARAAQAVDRLLAAFPLYPETPDIFATWRTLVEQHGIAGKRAHDARLAAFKQVHAVPYLITLNGRDFVALTAGVLAPEEARERA